MKIRILLLTMLPVICLAQVNPNGEKPAGELLSKEISPNEMKRNASFNVEEIKVRWKKAALENCTGVPCVVTPPAPSFTCGTSPVSDIEGNTYNTVAIGTQCWTKENLKVTKYNDGTDIPLDASGGLDGITGGENWSTRIAGAYTIYANQSSTGTNASNYGYLYNWYAVNDSKKLCPAGWHVPTDTEWTTLTAFFGGLGFAGGKMKQTGTTLWNTPNTGADNTSGFTGLPGGYRLFDGSFLSIRDDAFFWSASESGTSNAWYRSLSTFSGNVSRNNIVKSFGASVRCLRD